MKNSFIRNHGVALEKFPLIFSIVKVKEDYSFMEKETENIEVLKKALVYKLKSYERRAKDEDYQIYVNEIFSNKKKYDIVVRENVVNNKTYEIITISAYTVHVSLLNFIKHSVRRDFRYHTNVPFTNKSWSSIWINSFIDNPLDILIFNSNYEYIEEEGSNYLVNSFLEVYKDADAPCLVKIYYAEDGKRFSFHCLCLSLEESFNLTIKNKVVLSKSILMVSPTGRDFCLSNSSARKHKASIINGVIVVRDNEDFIENKRDLEDILTNIVEPSLPNESIPVITYSKYSHTVQTIYISGMYNLGNTKLYRLYSIPKQQILEVNRNRTPSNLLFPFSIKTRNGLYSSYVRSAEVQPGKRIINEMHLIVPYEEGENNITKLISSIVSFRKDAHFNMKINEKILESTLFYEGLFIKNIPEEGEQNFNEIIESWLIRCQSQGQKDADRLLKTYYGMKKDKELERERISILLKHSNYSNLLPFPSFEIKGLSDTKTIKNARFVQKNKVSVYSDILRNYQQEDILEEILEVILPIPSTHFRKGRNPDTRVIISKDIMFFYDKEENSIILSSDKLKRR